MRRRTASKIRAISTAAQVVLVGVLLLAVVWQLDGASTSDPEMPADPAPVPDRIEQPSMTTDDVNIRRGPGIDHDVITVLPKYSDVLVTGAAQNGFVPIEVNGTAAWVSDDYVAQEGSVLGSTTSEVPVVQVHVAAPVEEPGPHTEATAPEQPEPEQLENILVTSVSAAEVASAPEPEPESVPAQDAQEVTAASVVEPAAQVDASLTSTGERWVDVNRTTGIVTLYEGDRIVDQFDALIGRDVSPDGYYSTAVGTFNVHMMNRELTETPFAPGSYLTDFVGFDHVRSNGFHSPIRDANGNIIHTGGTTTLGCVRLGEEEAKTMYDFAFIGMRVEIHD